MTRTGSIGTGSSGPRAARHGPGPDLPAPPVRGRPLADPAVGDRPGRTAWGGPADGLALVRRPGPGRARAALRDHPAGGGRPAGGRHRRVRPGRRRVRRGPAVRRPASGRGATGRDLPAGLGGIRHHPRALAAGDRRHGLPRGPGRRGPSRAGLRVRPVGPRQWLRRRSGEGPLRLGTGQPGLTLQAAAVEETGLPSQAVLRRAGFTEAGSWEGKVRYMLSPAVQGVPFGSGRPRPRRPAGSGRPARAGRGSPPDPESRFLRGEFAGSRDRSRPVEVRRTRGAPVRGLPRRRGAPGGRFPARDRARSGPGAARADPAGGADLLQAPGRRQGPVRRAGRRPRLARPGRRGQQLRGGRGLPARPQGVLVLRGGGADRDRHGGRRVVPAERLAGRSARAARAGDGVPGRDAGPLRRAAGAAGGRAPPGDGPFHPAYAPPHLGVQPQLVPRHRAPRPAAARPVPHRRAHRLRHRHRPRPAAGRGRTPDPHRCRGLAGRPLRSGGAHREHRRPDGALDGRPLAGGPPPGPAAARRRAGRGADLARLLLRVRSAHPCRVAPGAAGPDRARARRLARPPQGAARRDHRSGGPGRARVGRAPAARDGGVPRGRRTGAGRGAGGPVADPITRCRARSAGWRS